MPVNGHAAKAAHSQLTVMTRNMDEWTDFGYITAAIGHPELLGAAIVQTFCEVVAGNVEQRAARDGAPRPARRRRRRLQRRGAARRVQFQQWT
jgi:hypothetical protein